MAPHTLPRNDSANSIAETLLRKMAFQHLNTEPPCATPLEITVLGLYAGAALNGVECVLLRNQQVSPVDRWKVDALGYDEVTVPLGARLPILNLLRDHPKGPYALLRAQDMLGQLFSSIAKHFCKNHNLAIETLDVVVAQADSLPPFPPNETVVHAASKTVSVPQSWPCVIAAQTGATVVANYAHAGRLAGSARLHTAPSVESLLLQHPTKRRVCITINELVKISVIPPLDSPAHDTTPSASCGPGTLFIDYAMRYATSNQVERDRDGSFGARGLVNNGVVDRFLAKHDYVHRAPPMSIAIEMFGHHEAQGIIDECLFLGMSEADMVASTTRITAENIVRQYRRILSKQVPPDPKVDEVFMCGPGARNVEILDYIEALLPEEVITRPLDDIGMPGDVMGAVCCAYWGLETVLKCVSSTGEGSLAEQQKSLGCIVARGTHWKELKSTITRFYGGEQFSGVSNIFVNPESSYKASGGLGSNPLVT